MKKELRCPYHRDGNCFVNDLLCIDPDLCMRNPYSKILENGEKKK